MEFTPKEQNSKNLLIAEQMRKSLPKDFCPIPFTTVFLRDNKILACPYLPENISSEKLQEEHLSQKTTNCSSCLKKYSCHKNNEEWISKIDFYANKHKITRLVVNYNSNAEIILETINKFPIKTLDIFLDEQFNSTELENILSIPTIQKRIFLNDNENIISTTNHKDVTYIANLYKYQQKTFFTDPNIQRVKFNLNLENLKSALPFYSKAKELNYIIEISIDDILDLDRADLGVFIKEIVELESNYDSIFITLFEKLKSFLLNNNDSPFFQKLLQIVHIKYIEIKKRRSRICTVPFNQVALFPYGAVSPCCFIPLYQLKDNNTSDKIGEIYNEKNMQHLRHEFISNNINICSSVIDEVSCVPQSDLKFESTDFSVLQKQKIKKILWEFDGSCGLECQMCLNWKMPGNYEEMERHYSDLKKNVLPYLSEFELAGGEPFFQKRTYDLIEFMKKENPDCLWTITTNGQHNFQSKIKDYIDNLHIQLFNVSIDSLDATTFEKIRVKGSLEKTLQFLFELIEYKNQRPMGLKFDININFTLQKDNWQEVEDIILFGKKHNLYIYISPVTFPLPFSIYDFDLQMKKQCLKYFQDLFVKYQHKNLIVIINKLKKDILSGN